MVLGVIRNADLIGDICQHTGTPWANRLRLETAPAASAPAANAGGADASEAGGAGAAARRRRHQRARHGRQKQKAAEEAKVARWSSFSVHPLIVHDVHPPDDSTADPEAGGCEPGAAAAAVVAGAPPADVAVVNGAASAGGRIAFWPDSRRLPHSHRTPIGSSTPSNTDPPVVEVTQQPRRPAGPATSFRLGLRGDATVAELQQKVTTCASSYGTAPGRRVRPGLTRAAALPRRRSARTRAGRACAPMEYR